MLHLMYVLHVSGRSRTPPRVATELLGGFASHGTHSTKLDSTSHLGYVFTGQSPPHRGTPFSLQDWPFGQGSHDDPAASQPTGHLEHLPVALSVSMSQKSSPHTDVFCAEHWIPVHCVSASAEQLVEISLPFGHFVHPVQTPEDVPPQPEFQFWAGQAGHAWQMGVLSDEQLVV